MHTKNVGRARPDGRAGRSGQHGQALTECLVVCGAALSAFLALPLLAKYQDIRLASVAASRTLAFECTVRFEVCADPAAQRQMAERIRQRHFLAHDRTIVSAGSTTHAGAAGRNGNAAAPNPFWRDRHQTPLIAGPERVEARFTQAPIDAVHSALEGAGRLGQYASDVAGPGAFGLKLDAGLLQTQITVPVSGRATFAAWMKRPEGLALTLSGRTAIVVDPWNAVAAKGADARTFESRVASGRRLPSPGSGATGHGRLIESSFDLAYLPVRLEMGNLAYSPLEPKGRLFRYHEIDVEVVPEDRLGEARR